jgi:hypothetical protein
MKYTALIPVFGGKVVKNCSLGTEWSHKGESKCGGNIVTNGQGLGL